MRKVFFFAILGLSSCESTTIIYLCNNNNNLTDSLEVITQQDAVELIREVAVMNTLTVNIHLMLVSFYQPEGKKFKILTEHRLFPSDDYTLQSHVSYHGFDPDEVCRHLKRSWLLKRRYDLRVCSLLSSLPTNCADDSPSYAPRGRKHTPY